jgi:hypothetical protein
MGDLCKIRGNLNHSRFTAVGLKYVLPYEKYDVPSFTGFFNGIDDSLPKIKFSSISFSSAL